MIFQEFEYLIQEEFINRILRPYLPEIVYRYEYEGHHYPGYEIGVNTNLCKLLFVWEQSGGTMIGSLSSSYENRKTGWFSLDKVTRYLVCQPFLWESVNKGLSGDELIVSTFRSERSALEPYVEKILTMFSSDRIISEWVSKYHDYEDEQFKLKYPAVYNEYKRRRSP